MLWIPSRLAPPAVVTAAVLALACGGAGSPEGIPDGPAELLLRGGAVYRMDAPRTWATAVGVKGGRIIYLGGG